MKLNTIIDEGFWHTYSHNKPVDTSQYTYYIDMDGVLADLATAIKQAKVNMDWRSPTALAKAIQDPANSQMVHDFYMQVPKTKEAAQIWKAATLAGKRAPIILTAITNGITGLADAKFDWVCANFNPLPSDFLSVGHRKKGTYAKSDKDVLIDDMLDNIKDWQSHGGAGILHQPGNLISTESGIQNPGGKLGFQLDPKSNQGTDTGLRSFSGGGRGAANAKYVIDNIARRMFHKTVPVQTETGLESITVWGVASIEDTTSKDLLGLFKHDVATRWDTDQEFTQNLKSILNLYATAIIKYARAQQLRPTVILVPESSTPIAIEFAKILAAKYECTPQIFRKNQDPTTIKVNPQGATAFAASQAKALTPEQVLARWQKQAARWATGEIKTKNLDMYLRRGNISNILLPPSGFDVRGQDVLIVDDIVTFGMTIGDIARTCLNSGADVVAGAVMWSMG